MSKPSITSHADLVATLPADSYYDPDIYQRERVAIFGCEWLWFSPADSLAALGSYVAHPYAGFPLMVVRTPSGDLRGFHNVCAHRAGPLVDDGSGPCSNLVCKYHGWSYAFDGTLRSARDFGATDLDPEQFALTPIRVEELHGQVFVNLDLTAEPLGTAMRGFFDEFAGLPIDEMQPGETFVHELACNWKTYADNYLEGYHIPLIHPQLNREIEAKQYTVTLGEKYCRHSAPARDGSISAGRWLFRYPNLAINAYENAMNIEVIVPTGPTTCTVMYNYFFLDRDDPANQESRREAIRLSHNVIEEDRYIVEIVQRNLASGSYQRGVLSPKHENGVEQFQSFVRDALEHHSRESHGS